MSIGDTIRERKTLKVLADEASPFPLPAAAFQKTMADLMELGACAPYHYPCDPSHQTTPLDSPAPWRFHALDAESCRWLMTKVREQSEPVGKVGSMLAAADGLILVTWLPDPVASPLAAGQLFEPTRRNMEHIAAASAAIQNMLLAATENGIHNYWSSGGAVLRAPVVNEWLSIPLSQILLGAVFLFPNELDLADTKPGANRGKQGDTPRWMRWVSPQ